MKPAESEAGRHLFRDVQLPVVLLNITENLNLGAISVGMPFLARAAGLSPEEAQVAAFLGISWIELMVCLNLVLGIYLFQRIRPKHAKPIKRKEKVRDQA